MKLGLKDPTPDAVKLKLRDYVKYHLLPTPPAEFGHWMAIPRNQWGILANDRYGCCAISGPEHQIKSWGNVAGTEVPFTDSVTLKNYGDITGFTEIDSDGQPWPVDPETGEPDNPTDQGTAIDDMAKYWRQAGLLDANSKRHQIVAYMDLDPGNLTELWVASYLFESVGMGFALPDTAQDQFARGEVWDVVPGAQNEGGHYVPCQGRATQFGIGITWGAPQPFTARFFTEYNDQGIVALDREMLRRGISAEGFKDQDLIADLTDITGNPILRP